MRYVEKSVEGDHTYLLPVGDIHIGDKNVDYGLLRDNLQWVAEHDNAYIVGVGDWLNVATRLSKSSPFSQEMDLGEQVEMCIEIFKPVKDKVLGVVQGNHEARLEDVAGYDPLVPVCYALGVPYLKYSAVVAIILNKQIGYTFFVHHSTGGGKTPGSKINRINELRKLVSNCDAYLGGHNHSLGVMPVITGLVDVRLKKIQQKRQLLIDCGSYLTWEDGYAERMGLEPCKLGSPRIRLDGKKRDLHCSI